MMEKVIPVSGWDFGDQPACLAKFASDGRLHWEDARRLIKRAGEEFVELARRIELHPGEEAVHQIAMGATEAYGPNRNGDGFKEATLKEYHPTFVKFARVYRNHVNRDPAKSYGVIKLSWYNPRMRRVELLLALNATKEAAHRNGGLVADRELEKLARGEDLAGSMSCMVPFDVCSSCGNRARSRSEYCDENSCIGPQGEKRGGCKRNLAKVAYDGHLLHVDNPNPKFFDYSSVVVPADRIAFGQLATYLRKAAEFADEFPGGAESAEMLKQSGDFANPFDWDPVEIFPAPEKFDFRILKQANDLRDLATGVLRDFSGSSGGIEIDDDWGYGLSLSRLPGEVYIGKIASVLMDRGMLAPLSFFIYASTQGTVRPGQAVKAARAVRPHLASMWKAIKNWPLQKFAEHIWNNPWLNAGVGRLSIVQLPADWRLFLEKKALDWYWANPEAASRKCMIKKALSLWDPVADPVPLGTDVGRFVAEQYTLYKMASLAKWAEEGSPQKLGLIGRYVIAENPS